MYADDLVVKYKYKTWFDTKSVLLSDIKQIVSWTFTNRLSINFNKSEFQKFANRSKLTQLKSDNLNQF